MADSLTPYFDLTLIEIGASKDTWGDKLNANLVVIDAALHAIATASDSSSSPAALLDAIKTVDGAGSGLDADKLDGKSAEEFALATDVAAAAILTKLLTVDGAGSNLDADKLDGKSAEEFSLATHGHDTTYLRLDGGNETAGDIKRAGAGGYLFNVDNAMNSGRVFLTPGGGPDPTSLPGEGWLTY